MTENVLINVFESFTHKVHKSFN